MVNSRRKGKAGELEAAKLLTKLLRTKFIRGAQHSGAPDAPDVREEVPGKWAKLHIEVKRDGHLNIHRAMDQSEKDAGPDKCPVVLHRKNEERWLVTMTAERWATLLGWVEFYQNQPPPGYDG